MDFFLVRGLPNDVNGGICAVGGMDRGAVIGADGGGAANCGR
jgi:hypothetical protein